ncbi:helix-turn-helix transcriptional regulator [Sphaerospermopsis sp. FACHB-1194]|uniref:helix-turn-helix domain-containing protein n=1 Tax=Sphaerospermopsis sp. FACHB-1194 TaxID=2692862 RepID=UPI00168053BA|nr:helix-turn-helix transcriptional regulator [Sphaerospermopsis sp. FACHB-1194]MBD2144598.1 helix-turn-helix transcriptional regulator [Sphaerospermopsis sp. FACHB-1194]
MPRSLRVHHDYIDKVKIAITLNGYPNQKALAHDTGLSPTTVSSFITGKPVDYTTFEELCRTLNLDWREIAITNEDVPFNKTTVHTNIKKNILSQDWGTAVDISAFYGRSEELTQLKSYILQDGCRLVAVVGMGGVGKTTFVTQLAQQIQDQFDYVFWRSVPTIPSFDDMITDMLSLISHHKESKPDINHLIHYFRNHQCLIILDNLDTALDAGDTEYNNFLRIIAETNHHSCVIFTSLEKPIEVAFLEQWTLSVRSLTLLGSSEVAFSLLQSKQLLGTDEQKYKLCDLYGNNPLKIKIVSHTIIDLFNGDLEKFLQQNTLLVSNYINSLLRQSPK